MKEQTLCRNREFVARCRRVIADRERRRRRIDLSEVVDMVEGEAPSRHYLDTIGAHRFALAIRRFKGDVGRVFRTEMARRRWGEFYDQIRSALEHHPSFNFEQATTYVLQFGRPSRFYISRRNALKLLRESLPTQP